MGEKEKADAGLLALFRSIHCYALYNDEAEREKLINNLAAEEDFSEVVYDILGIDRSKSATSQKVKAAKKVIAELDKKRTPQEVNTWWQTSSPKPFKSPFLGML